MFDFELQFLDLTEHQQLMLEPVEKRMQNILAPWSIGARVASKRMLHRKGKFPSKLGCHFAGNLANITVNNLSGVLGSSNISPGTQHGQELSTGRVNHTEWAAAKQKANTQEQGKGNFGQHTRLDRQDGAGDQ